MRIFNGELISDWFGITKEAHIKSVKRWTWSILFLIFLLIVWNISTEGCLSLAGGCEIATLSGSSLIELAVATIAIGWSIGIAIAQKEQIKFLEDQAPARQHFSENFIDQMSILSSHFGKISDEGDGESLDFFIFVSSPAFGILNGADGVKIFSKMVASFAEAAVARAKRGKQSELHMYLWPKAAHHALFSSTASPPQSFWSDSTEFDTIKQQIKGICVSLQSVDSANNPQTQNRKHHDLISVYVYEISQPVECRFFLLESPKAKKAAMISMIPLEGTVGSEQYSVLLTNTSADGYQNIEDFFHGFTSNLGRGNDVTQAAKSRGEAVCKAPETLFKEYFGDDILT
jgi:hypothetical protein